MMPPDDLRAVFVAFAGRAEARRFALQLRRDRERKQLRFWQMQLWDRFSQEIAGVTRDLDQIRAALLWCDVHDEPLQEGHAIEEPGSVRSRDGSRLDESSRGVWDEQFPFGFGFSTLVCPVCVEACQEWMDTRPEPLSKPQDYEPCFATVPDTWHGRWDLIREFARRWYGVSLGAVGAPSRLAQQAQLVLPQPLPPSFGEYCSFAEELKAQNAFGILRDDFEINRVPGNDATSLLLQGEGDVYWAVKDENLGEADPPVDVFYQDCSSGTGESFAHVGTCSTSITSFLLGHMAHFLHGAGGGCLVEVAPTAEFITAMRAAFPVGSEFGDLRIFEKQNVFALVLKPIFDEQHYLLVEVWREILETEIPDCVWAQTKHGGAFHGMLAPDGVRGPNNRLQPSRVRPAEP
jgi:hypothetical protein